MVRWEHFIDYKNRYSQSRRPLDAKLTVEYQNGFLAYVAACRRGGLDRVVAEQELLDASSSVDVDRARNVAPVIFVIKAAVDDVERS